MWGTLFNLAWPIIVVALLYRPVTSLVIWAAIWVVGLFHRPTPDGVPCPKCGYDCRVFDPRKESHRCPECGAELRWGQPL